LGNLAAECSDNMPLVRKALKQALAGWTEAVAGVVREGQANGSISPDQPPEELARFLVNSWEGAVVRMKIVNSRQPLDDFFSVALPLMTDGRGIGAAKGKPKKAATKRVKRKR
jgi:TetR/AcrR family transcriptional repressor of nem operon